MKWQTIYLILLFKTRNDKNNAYTPFLCQNDE